MLVQPSTWAVSFLLCSTLSASFTVLNLNLFPTSRATPAKQPPNELHHEERLPVDDEARGEEGGVGEHDEEEEVAEE